MTLRPVDGGPEFYQQFTTGLPTDPLFFPLGVWAESVVDETGWPRDKAAGLNTYIAPVNGTDLNIIKRAGMYALPGWIETSAPAAGYSASDEVDMWAGPGHAPWTGNQPGQGEICSPSTARCGYTVMENALEDLPTGMMSYSNYGKGVAFWESDTEAAKFVNDFVDVVSVDTYWFTDPNICGESEGGALFKTNRSLTPAECRRAANYGATTERVRSLVNPPGSKPVWNFIEVGRPFDSVAASTISGPEIRAAVWSSLIHGARGIVYFNHSFGGSCPTQHVLRDCSSELVAEVTSLNSQITRMAPILNAPWVDGLAHSDDAVDVAAKLWNNQLYILAGANENSDVRARIDLRCGDSSVAEVVDENRAVEIVNGVIDDDFDDGNAVHIYRVKDGNTCGLAS